MTLCTHCDKYQPAGMTECCHYCGSEHLWIEDEAWPDEDDGYGE